jgi:hypothetical protein
MVTILPLRDECHKRSGPKSADGCAVAQSYGILFAYLPAHAGRLAIKVANMDEKLGFKPPYNSFRTFWSFIGTLATKPLPPQLDRSMFDGKSGSDQMGLNFALQGFGLIASDEEKRAVKPTLEEIVAADVEGRKRLLGELIKQYYPKQVAISAANGTEDMLLDSFKTDFNLTGETRRKAATWFLHAMTEAGLAVSPHFPKVRAGGATQVTGSRRPRLARKKPATAEPEVIRDDRIAGTVGDEITVNLQAGGTVTLRVNVGHVALSRNKNDRDFVQKLMDALTAYEEATPSAKPMGVAEEEAVL